VAYIVVSLAVISLMTMLVLALRANEASEATLIAAELAAELMEEVKLKKWDATNTYLRPGYPSYSKSSPLGPEGGEDINDKTTFHDLDDFNGYTESPPKDPVGRPLTAFGRYRRTVTMSYVTSSLAPTGSTTNYKLVTVCVSRGGVNLSCLYWLATNK